MLEETTPLFTDNSSSNNSKNPGLLKSIYFYVKQPKIIDWIVAGIIIIAIVATVIICI